ncbi:DUF6266 family protein [Longitalea luteola]|uniref:DUF6266 family protein n=1 Tax=Longitalea luteola TaxID=2812563 RepID=UPI001A95C817|nr:DUF6266 family protein [Longitalea luteola]
MARLQKGILDDISGKVGKVVGSKWRGVNYIRSVGSKRSKSPTLKQEEQQAKFIVASSLSQSMHDLFELGFKDHAIRMTGTNYAQSLILKGAIIGDYPDFRIAYDRLLVSKGKLANVEQPAVATPAAGVIQFTWSDTDGDGKEKPTDVAILVAYCPELNRTIFKHGSSRDAKSATLNVPKFTGKLVHTWLTFMSANGKLMASSVYTGEVTIT